MSRTSLRGSRRATGQLDVLVIVRREVNSKSAGRGFGNQNCWYGPHLPKTETKDGPLLSRLERLRRSPTSVTATGMLAALARLHEIQALGVTGVDLSAIPPGRLAALARHAAAAKAQTVARMTPDRRDATLLATAHQLQGAATDDVLDLLDQLLGALLGRA